MERTDLIVAKFGGTSLADANRIRQVVDIIRSSSARRCIVVSAPGKRHADDTKITDLLETWINTSGEQRESTLQEIRTRFIDIVKGLGLSLNIDKLFYKITQKAAEMKMDRESLFHFMRSRGEWLNAQIVAAACGFEFVDAFDFITFTPQGKLSMRLTTQRAARFGLSEKAKMGIVVSGFYGRMPGGCGKVHSFSRGGSDITGAIVAVLTEASVYENWTDVEGVLRADPRIVSSSNKIDAMTYDELRELAFTGANVFHEDAAEFVYRAGIPTHIRCTMNPDREGTRVVPELEKAPGAITGVAGKNGFSIITVKKYGMGPGVGYLYQVAGVLKRLGISIQGVADTVDSLSVAIESDKLQQMRQRILDDLELKCRPDNIRVLEDVMLICTVGIGMRNVPGMAGRLMSAVGHAKVNIETISQGASEINIVIGVQKEDGARAIRAIHDEFFPSS